MVAGESAQKIRVRSTIVDVASSDVMKMGAENDCPEPSEQNPETYITTHKH